MVLVPVTVLGGLPVIADVWFSGPDYFGEYDAGVNELFWRKSDGSKGKPLPPRIMGRVERENYWEANVTEQANDWLSCHTPIRYPDGRQDGEWSEEYILLNGDPNGRQQLESVK